mgnify:CR=1 FL=1
MRRQEPTSVSGAAPATPLIEQVTFGPFTFNRERLELKRGSEPVHLTDRERQIEQVNLVLAEIGADRLPQVLVLNKIDLIGLPPRVERDEYGRISRVWLSAQSGEGVDLLRSALSESLRERARIAATPV